MTAAEVDNHAFGVRLLALRIAREWTPGHLAARAKVHRSVVRSVEDGNGCTQADAARLAAALDVELEQLIGTAGSGAAA